VVLSLALLTYIVLYRDASVASRTMSQAISGPTDGLFGPSFLDRLPRKVAGKTLTVQITTNLHIQCQLL